MKLPTIEGVVETSLYVTDLARSVKFYSEVLGFEPIGDPDERITAIECGRPPGLAALQERRFRGLVGSSRWRW